MPRSTPSPGGCIWVLELKGSPIPSSALLPPMGLQPEAAQLLGAFPFPKKWSSAAWVAVRRSADKETCPWRDPPARLPGCQAARLPGCCSPAVCSIVMLGWLPVCWPLGQGRGCWCAGPSRGAALSPLQPTPACLASQSTYTGRIFPSSSRLEGAWLDWELANRVAF